MSNHHIEEGVLLRAVDEELPPGQATRVKRHIEDCASCRGRFERLRRITEQIAEFERDLPEAGPAVAHAERQSFLARLELEGVGQSRQLRWLPWVLAPAALSLIVMAGLVQWTRHPHPAAIRAVRPRPAEVTRVMPKEFAAPVRAAKAHKVRKRPVPAKSSVAAAPAEIATPFFALPFSDASLPLAQATVIRVELPRSALAVTGLPVDEDRRNERINADLVVGADGLARAIRFVHLVR